MYKLVSFDKAVRESSKIKHFPVPISECDGKACRTRCNGDPATCHAWKDYCGGSDGCSAVNLNLAAINLRRNWPGTLASNIAAPVLLDSIGAFCAFAEWFARFLETHRCVHRLDVMTSEVVVAGLNDNGSSAAWNDALAMCRAANHKIAAAVLSMINLTHLRMYGFEFTFVSDDITPCMWMKMSCLDYVKFCGKATIPLTCVNDCVRFINCRCTGYNELADASMVTLVLDKVVIDDDLCAALASCANLKMLSIGGWIGEDPGTGVPRLPAPLSERAIADWTFTCKRLQELRILNVNPLLEVPLAVHPPVTVFNCWQHREGPPAERMRHASASPQEMDILTKALGRIESVPNSDCRVKFFVEERYPTSDAFVGTAMRRVNASEAFLDQLRTNDGFPYAHVNKLNLSPAAQEDAPGTVRVVGAEFDVPCTRSGPDCQDGRRHATLWVHCRNGDFRSVSCARLREEAAQLSEVVVRFPAPATPAAQFCVDSVLELPPVRRILVDTPIMYGLALEHFLKMMSNPPKTGRLESVSCRMYIGSEHLAHALGNMLRRNTNLTKLYGVVFRQSYYMVIVTDYIFGRVPPLSEFTYVIQNRGEWHHEYHAIVTLSEVLSCGRY